MILIKVFGMLKLQLESFAKGSIFYTTRLN